MLRTALIFGILGISHAAFSSSGFNTSIRCQDGPLLPTPHTGSQLTGPVFTACAETVLRGTVEKTYDAIIDFPHYPLWNSFTVRVDVPPNVSRAADVYIGMPMTFHTQGLLPPLNTTSNEVVTELEAPDGDRDSAFVSWQFDDGTDGAITQAEHPTIITDLGDGFVRVVSYETFYRLGALVILALLKERLEEEFAQQASDLKSFVERGGS